MRVLLIAEAANPEWVSVPLIGWCLSRAIAELTSAHLVTQIRNRDAIVSAGLIEHRDFTAIDSERVAAPLWRLGERLRGGRGVGWTTVAAFQSLSYYFFEHLLWRQFGPSIESREFDLVHRITPLSPTTPSTLAARCARAGVPFVLGPLNGGVAWPKEFKTARHEEREWLSYVRSAYKLLPSHKSTLDSSAAILVGSKSTLSQIKKSSQHKCIYLPENAIDADKFPPIEQVVEGNVLRACFVGRLVPYKGPDMVLEAMAPLLRQGRLHLDMIGDGPMMSHLRDYIVRNELETYVTVYGWILHADLHVIMSKSQLLLFPSVREFGGGVILEAMALGLVPVVVNYAGPGELVSDDVGFKLPLGSRAAIVQRLRLTVESICNDRQQLRAKSVAGQAKVRQSFTWKAKARQIMRVYDWVRGRASKPDFQLDEQR